MSSSPSTRLSSRSRSRRTITETWDGLAKWLVGDERFGVTRFITAERRDIVETVVDDLIGCEFLSIDFITETYLAAVDAAESINDEIPSTANWRARDLDRQLRRAEYFALATVSLVARSYKYAPAAGEAFISAMLVQRFESRSMGEDARDRTPFALKTATKLLRLLGAERPQLAGVA
jgi:hypothetical protein